jgi:glucuronoarabinoxylan endo-1,4-beta-xylanase
MNHTSWVKDLNEDNRAKAFGNAPGEMGLSILRVHIDPNKDRFIEQVSSTTFAIKQGAKVFGTPWNAPDEALDTTATESRVDPSKYELYAAHLNSFNTFMKNNGASLYAISVQNEPDYGDWTRWTSSEMVNFLKDYGQNIDNRVMAPESFQFRRDFTDPILNDSAAAANVEIIGGHIYGGGLMDYPLAREKGKEVWMTEHLLGSDPGDVNDWNLAMVVGNEINDCMNANFNAYVWWYIRRFYGLITDDGNITDKGYVMSQYTKFIRPGAVRVDALTASVLNVEVSAFKTDTSLVIVVLNNNIDAVSLDFNVLNGTFEKLTQFTSSDTKKVVNEGEIAISGGAFSATLDASSITTFTTSAINGGKQGNIKPVAVAGDDLNLDDIEGIGIAVIKLDGSLSSDTDGEISNYSWSLDGQQISWETTHELTISIGEYDLVLTVTDNDGATDTDTLHIALTNNNTDEIWFEAECGTVGATWNLLEDENASDSRYVETPAGIESLASASTNPDDLLVYTFTTTETGSYKVWARVIAPNANDDSYWVKVDTSSWAMWNGIPSGADWHWDDVHDQSNDNPLFYMLEPGEHTLSICMREDGAKLDKILVTNTGTAPTDLGSEAISCKPEEPIGIKHGQNNKSAVTVYPNPSTGKVTIQSAIGFNSLNVINSLGQSVYHKNYINNAEGVNEVVDLEQGLYLIILRNENSTTVNKLIIEK